MPVRRTQSRIHAIAGGLAFVLVASFFLSSAIVEAVGHPAWIVFVKRTIAWSLPLLVAAMAATGASGFAMVGMPKAGPLAVKLRRMRLIAANGLLVLVPAALFLAWKAPRAEFDASFVIVQGIEFVAGPVNLMLIALNVRDGLRLTARRRKSSAPAT